MEFPDYNDFVLQNDLPSINDDILELHEEAISSCLGVPKPDCYFKYYQMFCSILLRNKLYDIAIKVGQKGLKKFAVHYTNNYFGKCKKGYFTHSGSEFTWEGWLVRDVGKSMEKAKKFDEAIKFYENYLIEGHFVFGFAEATQRLAILYKKNKDIDKSKEILEYALKTFELPEIAKIVFQDRLNKLNNKSTKLNKNINILHIKSVTNKISTDKFPLSMSRNDYKPVEIDACNFLLKSNPIVFKTENTYWWSIQSLLYYEEIFAEIPRQTFPGYQNLNGMPSDFFSGDKFYNRRKELFIKKNKYLINSDLNKIIIEKYEKHKNENIRHLIKNHITLEGLKKIIKVTPSNLVVKICDRINSNVTTYRTGLPDLFVSNDQNQMKLVEVKKKRESIKNNQKLWLEFLHNIGVNVEVIYVDTKN